MTPPKSFKISIEDWKGAGSNALVQGLNVHRRSGTLIGHQADDVTGQTQQDVIFRQHKADGTYIGAVTVKKGGHGSSTGLEDVDGNTVRTWFGHDGLGTSGYAQWDIGKTGLVGFVAMDLPEGDIELDQDNNQLVLRNKDRYRIYKFDSVKANNRVKIADFVVPHWGKRWQGMFLCEGRLFVHRDVETNGASHAHMFDLKGKLLADWDTSKMGSEAEGFFATKDGDTEVIYAVKRTGPLGPKRIIQGTQLVVLPKATKEVSEPMTISGVDVSSYQKGWKPRAADKFVFIKATEGRTVNNDYRHVMAAAGRKAGLQIGFYHWLHKGNLEAQAKYFMDNVHLSPGDLLVVDWEQDGVSYQEKDEFIKLLKKLNPEHKVGLYCNTNWWTTKDKSDYYGDFLWIAQYSSSQPRINDKWTFWQYTDKPLDQNRSIFKTQADLKKWALELKKKDLDVPDKVISKPPVLVQPKPPVPVVVAPKPAPVVKPSAPLKDLVEMVKKVVEVATYKIGVLPKPASNGMIRWRGMKVCTCTVHVVLMAEYRMKKADIIKYSIDATQASYNRGGVSQSAGTHDGGGSLDVRQYSTDALKIWRECGAAAWHRTPSQGNWGHHGHLIVIGCPHASAGAKRQVAAYKAGKNGLANGRSDDGPDVKYITWQDARKKYGSSKVTQLVKSVIPASKTIVIAGKQHEDVLSVSVAYVNENRDGKNMSRHVWYVQKWLNAVPAIKAHLEEDGVWDHETQQAFNRFRRTVLKWSERASMGNVGLASLKALAKAAKSNKKIREGK